MLFGPVEIIPDPRSQAETFVAAFTGVPSDFGAHQLNSADDSPTSSSPWRWLLPPVISSAARRSAVRWRRPTRRRGLEEVHALGYQET